MNRKLRRAMKAGVGKLAHPIPDSVTLTGGPMDGWTVKPDAAALQADWWRTWIPSIASAWAPGRYVLVEGGGAARATWTPLEG